MATEIKPVETPFYSSTEKKDENIDDYDVVLFTTCDIFGRPRGKFASRQGVKKFVDEGIEMQHTTSVLGLHSEAPETIPAYNKKKDVTYLMYPDLSTLRPLSWLDTDRRKVGQVLCDLYDADGKPDPCSPRYIAMRQLDALRDMGYQIMTAFETEFFIFQKGTLNALGGNVLDMANMLLLDREDNSMVYDYVMSLIASGIPVETLIQEYAPGQMELSMQPQYGIKMADIIHRFRFATKSICQRAGLDATVMPKPKGEFCSSGFHFNHSLWTLDGKNAFYDQNGEDKCSTVLRHWIAGLLKHGKALLALMNPTVNCFERLHGFFAPGDNVWNYGDRNARIRVKTKRTNVHIEERTPSSAANPYLCLAGLLAAGMDGLVNKMECPPPRNYRPILADDERSKCIDPLPKTLEDALNALEQDTDLTKALGEEFVKRYIALSRECQLEKLKGVKDKEQAERIAAQRDLYFNNL